MPSSRTSRPPASAWARAAPKLRAWRPATANARSSTARSPISPRSASRGRRANWPLPTGHHPAAALSLFPQQAGAGRTRVPDRVRRPLEPGVDPAAAGPVHAAARAAGWCPPPVRRGDLPARVDPHYMYAGPSDPVLNRRYIQLVRKQADARVPPRGAACLRAARHGRRSGRGGDRVRVEPARRRLLHGHARARVQALGSTSISRRWSASRNDNFLAGARTTYPQLLARFAPEALSPGHGIAARGH